MAKKKSKTQKMKKNLKRKQNKAMGNITKDKSNIIKVDKEQKEKLIKVIDKKIKEEEAEESHSKIVEKDKVDYKVLITYENKEKIKKESKSKENKNSKKENDDLSKTKEILKQEIKSEVKEKVKDALDGSLDKPSKIVGFESLDDITSPFIGNQKPKKKKTYIELVFSRIKKNINEQKKNNKNKEKQKEIIELPKLKSKSKNVIRLEKNKATDKNKKQEKIITVKRDAEHKKTTNVKKAFAHLLITLYNNGHIIFNSIGIILYIIMIVGLVRIDVLKVSTIIYISCIVGFLLFIAISFNKWISGKIFTVIISIGMIMAIYHMQYTYDFIRNLNSGVYEYKTYYVVTFDNGVNKSIYNINSKKVGLLKDNCTNIERKIDTKIEPEYIEYDDINKLFDDFYNQEFRAILVNENQYKYMKNNIQNNRAVKILYEFKANAKK